MENNYVGVNKEPKDQVSFYKQELLKEKMYGWQRNNVVEMHASHIGYTRDEMIEDLYGCSNMLYFTKIGITYADLLLATEELWAELEEARDKYKETLEAAEVDQEEPQEAAE